MLDMIIVHTSLFMNKILFSPLLLIALLITSLSLILNLKDSNIHIQKFKDHPNMVKFINKVFQTSLILLFVFIISLLSHFICDSIILVALFFLCMVLVIWNLFIIVYTLKEIVITSLKD